MIREFFFFWLLYLSLLHPQVSQLTCVLDERLKEEAEVIEQEKGLKEVAEVIAREKGEAANASERKAVDTEKARQVAKRALTDMVSKLEKTELKLVKADSLCLI